MAVPPSQPLVPPTPFAQITEPEESYFAIKISPWPVI